MMYLYTVKYVKVKKSTLEIGNQRIAGLVLLIESVSNRCQALTCSLKMVSYILDNRISAFFLFAFVINDLVLLGNSRFGYIAYDLPDSLI